MVECRCGSRRAFSECCEPYIERRALPKTAEECMRSRFTAYALGHVDYLVYSHDPDARSPKLREAIGEWAARAEFQTLRVITTEAGRPGDDSGRVHFEADYNEGGESKTLAEMSEFRRYDGRWVYSKGYAPKPGTFTRTNAKIGRNDPCPCGSGKKFKKCCA